ncbi:Cytochrome c oxidase subunit 2, partial [Atta colombica]
FNDFAIIIVTFITILILFSPDQLITNEFLMLIIVESYHINILFEYLLNTRIKIDFIPGRLNQSLLFINRLGVFFGQCYEICDINHRLISIAIESTNLILKTEFINFINNNLFNSFHYIIYYKLII